MTDRFRLSPIPIYCKSLTTSPPKHKALLIGINYASSDNDTNYCGLKGPINDAKEIEKALIELFYYKEKDICLMTDEEANQNTTLWPSKANIMHALRDLVCDACPGDSFVFFYAGHCGQQPVTTDVRETDGLDEYIATCDDEKILDNTLRECLIDALPTGTRLTAILDACHSGTLLDLDHYYCHSFLRRRAQTLPEKKAKFYERPSRHHSVDLRYCTRHFRRTFSFFVTVTLVIVRFKIRLVKKQKQVEVEVEVEVEVMSCIEPRGSPSCAHAVFPTGPLVISVSSCSDPQSTWEDSKEMGKSMTTELVKILRENPSINVGDLHQQLQGSLEGMAYKRLWEAKSTFKKCSAKLSPQKRKKYEGIYTEKGVFEFKPQTTQFGSLHRLRQEEEFIVKRAYTLDLQLNPLLHPS